MSRPDTAKPFPTDSRVDGELAQRKFTFLFGEICDAYPRVELARKAGRPGRADSLVNRQKSRVCSTDGVEFLGFLFSGYGGQIRISPKNIQKFKDRVREITRRQRGVSMTRRCQELRRYFQGWVGYFSLVPLRSIFSKLDKWIRRRIRSCYWKQWRKPRTRIAKLRKMGVRALEAILHGISNKGPWVMSKTEAIHIAITVDYLRKQGLVSLEELWKKFAPKWRTA